MNAVHDTYLGLGGNVSPRRKSITDALTELASHGVVVATSPFVESPAWGYQDHRTYINAVCHFRTELSPIALLDLVESLERRAGRSEKTTTDYAPRTLDIDILFYDQGIVNLPRLIIPHPRLHLRKFVLVPLAAIAPDLIHPTLRLSVMEMLEKTPDTSKIHILPQ